MNRSAGCGVEITEGTGVCPEHVTWMVQGRQTCVLCEWECPREDFEIKLIPVERRGVCGAAALRAPVCVVCTSLLDEVVDAHPDRNIYVYNPQDHLPASLAQAWYDTLEDLHILDFDVCHQLFMREESTVRLAPGRIWQLREATEP